MGHPESVRFVPIREAICSALADAPPLAEVKTVVRDREAFAALAASQYPAIGVFFADPAGREKALYAAGGRDHSYQFEVHVAVRALEGAQACEDLLFAYVEAVEDALRAAPTLGGLVRYMGMDLVRRRQLRGGAYWQAQAALIVRCEHTLVH